MDATLADGKSTTLGLVASSIHPQRAGVQVALIDALLEGGAAINGLEPGGEPVLSAIQNGRETAAEALAERGARLDNIVVAAALGRLDLVRVQLTELAGGVRSRDAGQALNYAGLYGRTRVAEFLLHEGVDPAAGADVQQTGMHFAAHGAHLETVRMFIERKAPLELKNMFGGTVLGQAVWSALHEPAPDHPAIIRALVEAGANVVEAGYPTGYEPIDRLLAAGAPR